MDNPFKKTAENAKETAKQWETSVPSSAVASTTCQQCGAPRPVNTNISQCSYCGHTFMNVDVFIKKEKDE